MTRPTTDVYGFRNILNTFLTGGLAPGGIRAGPALLVNVHGAPHGEIFA